jgi:DNA-binding SARP family transcriptional activator
MVSPSHLGVQNQPVQLKLMGEFSCATDKSITFSARSAAEVVAYLAIHKSRWVPREEIAEAIWPFTDPKVARTNLRKALQRVRESFGIDDLILKHGENIALNSHQISSDLDEARVLHRQYVFAPHLSESIDLLLEEWRILAQSLLEGWDAEWINEQRTNFEMRAHELGLRVIDALEANGRFEECLAVLEQMLKRSPLEYELLQKAMRIQSRTVGNQSTGKMLEQLLINLPPMSQIPKPVRRLIQQVRQSQLEQVPAPEQFETKNELAMLARMIESNLKANNPEAMALLARESSNVDNWSHAKTLLSILIVALENSDLKNDDQITVAINACFLATYASDFQVGEWAAQMVLNVLEESDPRYIRTTSVLGFLHFETKNYDHSRELHDRALSLCRKYSIDQELSRVLNRKAVLEYHLGNFDVAHPLFVEAINLETKLNDPMSESRLASVHGNLCTMEVLRFRWDAARNHGESAFKFAESSAKVYKTYTSAALGLSRYKLGDPKGIALIIDGITQTARERLLRFNMMSIDFGVAVLIDKGANEQAAQIASVNRLIRQASGYPRGPAEVGFMKSCFDHHPKGAVPSVQPMSLVALSRWMVEELEVFI